MQSSSFTPSPAGTGLPSRRNMLEAAAVSLAATALAPLPPRPFAATSSSASRGVSAMSTVTTKDGVEIFFKDWGPKDAQPIMFHHGWPLSSDDRDAQMQFFVLNGYRVVAHDRRGYGRSRRSPTVTTWTTTPPTPSPSSSILT